MSLAFEMFQVWQMLKAAKWLITGTEEAQDKEIGPRVGLKQNDKGRDRGR